MDIIGDTNMNNEKMINKVNIKITNLGVVKITKNGKNTTA